MRDMLRGEELKIAIVAEKQSIWEQYGKILQKKLKEFEGWEVMCLFEARDPKKISADILITMDLCGFDQVTLTNNVSYNLLNCKQLHLLLHRNLSNETCLAKQLSISMFFYCLGDGYYDYLRENYPNLPYLHKISHWDLDNTVTAIEKNAVVLYAMLKEIIALTLLG